MKVSLPLQLLLVIGLVVVFGSYIPLSGIRGVYTFSVMFKEALSFFLPFIVFTFIASGVLSFKKNAPIVLAVLLGAIFCSNIVVSLFSYGVGRLVLDELVRGVSTKCLVAGTCIQPFFSFSLPPLVSSEKAMLAAVSVGIILSFLSWNRVAFYIHTSKIYVEMILKRAFIPLLPLYVFGFMLKIYREGTFTQLFAGYGKAFGLIIMLQVGYLIFMYVVASGFNLRRAYRFIQNALPSYVTALSTMSSTATIPVSVAGAEENTGNEELAAVSMPIMANVHLLGDCITTPILSLVTLVLFSGSVPDLVTYAHFIFFFSLTMLAASGVPGGGIIVMIPILKSILGFTPDMISVITTLYLLQDGFGTAGNVMGDGALVIIVHSILRRLGLV